MATLQFIQAPRFTLAGSGTSIGDTTIVLQSMVGIDLANIVTADLGTKAYGTLEPGNGVQEEAISFTGVTQNANGTATLTGVKTCLFKSPYTETSGLAKTHAGASTFILSNDAAFYGNIMTFVNTALSSGAVPATTSVNGIVQMSVTPASGATPVAIGINNTLSSGAVSLANPVVDVNSLSTVAASGAVVRASLTTGKIDTTYITAPTASPTIQSFTSSGTWTKPTGVKKIIVECVGAGGAGGTGHQNSGGAGGGGGGYSRKVIDAAALTTITVTLSSATTLFTGYNSASSGSVGGTVGGAGGAGSGGDFNIVGNAGGSESGAASSSGSSGGGSVLGGGGIGGSGTGGTGYTGGNYGGGGGGGSNNGNNGGSPAGGSGAGGICIVTEFYS